MENIRIVDTNAENIHEYGIKMKIIKYSNYKDVQNSPCAFGTFCMLYNGVLITDHPISHKRFTNIMNKILKK